MTMSELKSKIREILPDASFDENKNGELVINTGLALNENDENLIRHWKFAPYEQ